MRPSHTYKGGTRFDRYLFSAKDWAIYQQSASNSPAPDQSSLSPSRRSEDEEDDEEVNAGLFSPVNTSQTMQWLQQAEDLEAKIWDRMPAEDHTDIELPSKVNTAALHTPAISF